MSKQIHIRLEDAVYEALSEYSIEYNSTMQGSISTAVMQLINCQKTAESKDAAFKFIDFLAGIGEMRTAFDLAWGALRLFQ